MEDWALIIHGNTLLARELAGFLTGDPELHPVCAANLKEAREILEDKGKGACKLIVAGISAPVDADTSVPVGRVLPTATEFLREVRKGADRPAAIFVVDADAGYMEYLNGLKNAELIAVGSLRKLPELAKTLAWGEKDAPKSLPHRLDVKITLTGDLHLWQLTTETGIVENGGINISPRELNDLVRQSRLAGAIMPDQAALNVEVIRKLGRDMYDCFVGNSIKSQLGMHIFSFTNGLTTFGGTRLRFEVNAKTSPLMVEALARPMGDDEDAEQDLWMLKLPIFRKFGNLCSRPPLFQDKASETGPVKCLLIQGTIDAFDSIGPIARSFGALPGATEEIAWLADHLADHRVGFRLDPPKLLRACDYAPGEFAAVLRDTLKAEHWQLIHYSGHSGESTTEAGSKAYLVLGPDEKDQFDLDTFAECAAHAQFVFLNSCSSGSSSFILRLVEHNIPAVLGYARPVPDQTAARFSKDFYLSLFPEQETGGQRFLEYAFMHAKAALYNAYPNEPLWTSPLLFMQILDTQKGVQRAVATGAMP